MKTQGVIGSGKVRGLAMLAAAGIMAFLAGCQSPAMQLRNQGLSLYHQGRYQAALSKFHAALQYNQSEPRGNYYAGAADFMLGRYEQAVYHYKLAWQVDPNYGNVKSAMAEALIKEGKSNEALNFLEHDAALTGRVTGRLRVARFYARLGDLDDARVNYMKAAVMARQNPAVLVQVGKFFDRLGQKTQAARYYEQAYRDDPSYPGLVPMMLHDGVTISDALLSPPLPAPAPVPGK